MIFPAVFTLQPELDRLMNNVAALTAWERVAGTAEEAQAFDYLEQTAKSCGAEVTRLLHDAYISVPETAELFMAGQAIPCQTHSMVVSTPADGLTAEVIYVPDGKAGLSKMAIKGKIVMLSGRGVGGPVMQAQRAGAVGVIFLPQNHIYEMCVSEIWGTPTLETLEKLPQIPVISVLESDGMELRRKAQTGTVIVTMLTKVLTQWRQIPLLTAEIKSKQPTKKFVMFSGHVDSWYYGATDNAAANSVMLETLRLAAIQRENLARNLRLVFFSGHSQGRYAGSAWYSDNYWEDLYENCCVNINADVLGGIGAVDVTRAVTMSEVKPVICEAVREIAQVEFIGKRYARHADQSFWGIGISSGLASFSKQIQPVEEICAFAQPKGGPADLGWWWHTPEDTLDKIDCNNLLRDAKIFAAIVLHFTISPVLPLYFKMTIAELKSIITDWQAQAGELFSLQEPLKQLAILAAEYESFENQRQLVTVPAEIEGFNKALLAVGRQLVALNYTEGKLYQNDEAVALPPVPALQKIIWLGKQTEVERKFLKVELVRRRTYVVQAIRQAIKALTDYKDRRENHFFNC